MIPVVGTLIVNEIKWLKRQINSVDFPVENYIIINNSGGELDHELENLVANNFMHKYIKNLKVYHMPYNIGCAGGWNMIMKSFMHSPYWVIINHDCSFGSGFLKEMYEAAQDKETGLVFGNGGDFGLGSFDLFLIKDWVIQSHGYFDENLYPCYGEDSDYIMRLHIKPVKTVLNLQSKYFHGDGTMSDGANHDYYETGMNTKKYSPELYEKLTYSNDKNFEYLFKKWGPGWRKVNPWKHPFNIEGLDIRSSIVDLEFCRDKHLGF